ncbi:MAG: hypothetical protein H7Z75_02150 [Ferruginibacter sp.]|nr:hypothetical protein [Cytophagales bacterium]
MTPNAVRKTTRLWLTLSYLFSSACLWAQTGGNAASELPKVIPPSPEAAALGKYGALPVGLYTGVPSISVPLYEIKGRRLTLPVSLNYHASGVRVDEVASWVGLGWTLNAGGVITRSVKGMPDEQDYLTGNYLIPD